MEGNNPEQVAQARNGPIKDYLDSYADRKDSQTEQIRKWADRYDIILREQQLVNRLKLPPEGEAESHARRALTSEEGGDWDGANQHWREAAKLKNDADEDLRVWGLLAERRIQLLATAAALDRQLTHQVTEAQSGQEFTPTSEMEAQAVKAIRLEGFGDLAMARTLWQTLKERFEKDMEQRPWFLLAAKRLQALKMSTAAAGKEESNSRRQRVKGLLGEARRLAAEKRPLESQQARLICADIIDLYHDSSEPGLKELIEQAQRLGVTKIGIVGNEQFL